MMPAMPELVFRLPQNILRIFSGRNLWGHALAIGLTLLTVSTGFDWAYFQATRGETILRAAFTGVLLGSLMPMVAVLVPVIVGALVQKRRLITTGWALGQAALLGYLISCGYKAFTGRLPPPHIGIHVSRAVPLVDTSHGFQFGFLRGGVFWGWPSSHTTIAFAMSACLIALYPRNKLLVVLALGYAFGVGLGVSMTIHWFSEFAAGAIIGSVIGHTVGKSFQARLG